MYRFLLKAVFSLCSLVCLIPRMVASCWRLGHGRDPQPRKQSLLSFSPALGFSLISESEISSIRTIGIDGTHGLWIGDPCNGLVLFALFVGFVLVYPGPWKKKLWFIPFGIVTIHILNVLRIVGLALTVHYFPDPELLDFNHTVYVYLFGLWVCLLPLVRIWATRFAKNKIDAPNAS